MDITILLTERLKAEYSVEQVDAITYTIRLKRFEGERKPPLFIRLQKTSAGWVSAFNDTILLFKIGTAIDAACG